MSALASIQPILSVEKHPNADTLDLVKVLGYTCIVKRDAWKVGDLAVLIEPDSVLPKTKIWAQPYLSFAPSRVRAKKIRGVWSFGLVVPITVLEESA